MADFKKILVAVAFSLYTEEIFLYAADLAKRLDAELTVVSIINERDVYAVQRIVDMGYKVDGEHYAGEIAKERQNILDTLIKKANFPSDRVQAVFKVGNPVEALLKVVLSEQPDMIVMGIKGRTDLEHIFVGSVAEKVFRRSPVTVLSYRDEKSKKRLAGRIQS